MLKRALGVKGAVLALYAMAASFATLGVAVSLFRARVSYVLALLLASFIGVTAIKIARRRFLEAQTASFTPAAANPDPAASSAASPAVSSAASPAVSPAASPAVSSAPMQAPAQTSSPR
jgi:zona occludens toxin (predicted ATPase)